MCKNSVRKIDNYSGNITIQNRFMVNIFYNIYYRFYAIDNELFAIAYLQMCYEMMILFLRKIFYLRRDSNRNKY